MQADKYILCLRAYTTYMCAAPENNVIPLGNIYFYTKTCIKIYNVAFLRTHLDVLSIHTAYPKQSDATRDREMIILLCARC